MIRLIVVLAATFGVGVALALFFPAMREVAFNVSRFGITWVMLASAATCFAAVKVTK